MSGLPPTTSRKKALGLGAVLFALQVPLYAGYLTDDTFIYARFARNLAETGQLVFNPGQPVHAVTSPPWALLGAVGVRLGFDAFWTLKVLGIACGLLAVALFVRVATRWLPPPFWALAGVAMLATEPWFVRWSCSGMETPLAAALVLVVLDLGLREPDRVPWTRLGWTLGLAPLVRPELAVFSALVTLLGLRDGRVRRRPGFWLGLAVPSLLWIAYAVPTYGAFWPETIQAKSTPLGLRPGRLAGNLRVMATLFALGAAVPTLAVVANLRWRRWSWTAPRELGWLTPAVWLWIVALPAIYLARDVQVVSRYLEVVLPPVVLLGAARLARSRRERAWRPLAVAQVALGLILTVAWIAPSTRAFSRTLEAGLGDIAAWLVENSREDDLVAIYDIGFVGYRSRRPILDLGGLVAPGINDLRNRKDDEEIVREGLFLQFGRPRYLVHRDARGQSLAGSRIGAMQPVPLLERTVANLGLSRSAPVVYTLYRLDPVTP